MITTRMYENMREMRDQPAMVVYAIAGLLLATGILRILYMRYFHPLARFPGPFIASISNVYYARSMLSGSHHRNMLKLHGQYGPIVRLAPNELSFSSLSSRDDIYGFKAARRFLKSPLYDGFVNGNEPSLVGIRDPILHGKKKRFLSHAFSTKALKSHEETINAYSDLFVQQAAIHGGGSEGVDMTQWYNWYSFDVVGDLAFGESFNCLKDVKDHFWVRLVFNHSASIIRKDVLRRFPLVSKILELYVIPKEIVLARRNHYLYSAQRVKDRLDMKTDRKDFMSYLLDAEDEDGLINQDFLTVSASTFVVAGSETTATALAGITYWLLKTPTAWEKLFAELQGRFDSYGDIRPDVIQDIPYLNACIEEGMRLFPPSPQALPRVSPGATVSDVYVPAGTVVSSHPIVMNRDPHFFHLPNEFIPERWLRKTDRLEASQPFLIGPRACIGRNLAYTEMRLLLAKLVFSFEMKLVNGDLDWDRDTNTSTFWEKPDLMVQFRKREKVQ
ncbi:putative cytochrome P450 [Ilyonectria destructans]|nr:putative cytochrome P450 [Ilyonectria destructans]